MLYTASNVSSIAQYGAIGALEGSQQCLADFKTELKARRDLFYAGIRDVAPQVFSGNPPEGAFYVFPSIAGCLGKTSPGGKRIDTDADFALALLEEKHVAAVQGAAYGMSPYIRISYATDTASLREACARIQEFCKGLA